LRSFFVHSFPTRRSSDLKGVVLMGYYNDGPTKRKGGGWLLPIIIGLAVGVLLMLVIYPNLSGNNVALNDAPEEQSTSEPEVRQEQVNVNVSTQITEIVDSVSL